MKYNANSPKEGGIGIFGFAVLVIFLDRFLLQKTLVFRFWWSLRFADFSFFSIWFSVFVKNTSGFSVLVPDVVFGFSYFVLFWVPVSVEEGEEEVEVSSDDNNSQGQQDELGASTNFLFGARSRCGRAVRFNNQLLF